MKKLTFHRPQDYLAFLVRRRNWIMAPFLLLSLASVAITMLLPRIYESETLIMVEPREVPSDFVKDLVTVSTDDRLRSIQKTILSRTNLLQIIYEFEPNLVQFSGLNDSEKVDLMRKHIQIEFQEDRRSRETVVSYFSIVYENPNPELAQRITSRLADLFIQYDSKSREEQVQGTAQFIQNELDKVSKDLTEADQRLKTLKEKYRYELPEQLNSNLLTLDRLQARAVATQEAMDRYFSERQLLERQISETSPVVVVDASARRSRPTTRTAAPSPLVAEYRQKEKLLSEAAAKYTDKHPEVIRLTAELERLRGQIPPSDLIDAETPEVADAQVTEANPAYQSLVKQLAEVKTEIEIKKRDQERTESEIRKYQVRVQNTPTRELELTETERRYNELKAQYDGLKGKLDDAKLAANLENVQKGAQFSIQDPANLPVEPAKPNRLKILLIGLLGSLFAGLAIGLTVDIMQQKVWTQSELASLIKVPVLVEIPEIATENTQQRNRRKRLLHGAVLGAATVATMVMAILIYASPQVQSLFAKLLSPVVEAVSRVS